MRWLQHKRGIVFDLDGVLFNSSAVHAEAFRAVLAQEHVHDFDYRAYAGMRTDEVFRRVLEGRGCPCTTERVSQLCARKHQLAQAMLRREPPVVPGCQDVLQRLQATHRLALATSASADTMNIFLEASGARTCFQSMVCSDDVQEAKPSPRIYEWAITCLSLRPHEVAVVEDSLAGVAAGRASGAEVIGVTGTEVAAALLEAGVVAVVRDIRDLLDVSDRT